MDIILLAVAVVYRVAGTGYSQLDSLSLMEKLLSRLAPPRAAEAGRDHLANAADLLAFCSIPKTYFYFFAKQRPAA